MARKFVLALLLLLAAAGAAAAQGYCPNTSIGAADILATSPYTIGGVDMCRTKIVNSSGAFTLNLQNPPPPNFNATIMNIGAGTVTVTPPGSVTINGLSSMTLTTGQSAVLSVGTNGNWYAATNSGSIGGVLGVPNGGTGRATLTAHGLLVGEGTSAINQLAAGTANQVPVSGGASADPSYSNALLAPNVASGADQVTVLGSVSGSPGVVGIQGTGTDTNIATLVLAKGSGGVYIGNSGAQANDGLQVATPAGTIVNQLIVTPSATGVTPSLTVGGSSSDANQSLNVAGQGTGIVTLGQALCTASGATPQTCNGQRGIVTTGTLTTAASTAAAAYVINDNSVTSSSLIDCTVNGYSGTIHTNGVPVVTQCVPGTGTITAQIQNVDTANALNGTVKIGFVVLN